MTRLDARVVPFFAPIVDANRTNASSPLKMPPPSAVVVIVDVDADDAFTDVDARDDARRRAHRDRAVEETDSHRIARIVGGGVPVGVVAIAGARRALPEGRFVSVGRSSSRAIRRRDDDDDEDERAREHRSRSRRRWTTRMRATRREGGASRVVVVIVVIARE